MNTHKGIYYFETFQGARSHAAKNNLPTDRIIAYGRGWAIQLYCSGPYAGPPQDKPTWHDPLPSHEMAAMRAVLTT